MAGCKLRKQNVVDGSEKAGAGGVGGGLLMRVLVTFHSGCCRLFYQRSYK